MEKISSDVLVIGNGAAGLRAAIASRETGADVLVISKSPPGLGTCTLLSGGALGAALGGLSQEAHRAITLESGRGINQPDLVEAFVSEAPSRLQELAAWGMNMSISPGYATARGAAPAFGRELIRTLLDRARRIGVRFLSPLAAHTLVADGSRGVSTLAYEFKKGLWIGFASKAVVLASGGCGALYPRHDNPQRITGDGYALALKAGAKLLDMEFVQFYALGAAEPGRPPFLVLPGVADFGVLTNDQGEDLLEKYDIRERPAAAKARDRLAQVLFHEIQDKGQRVYLDLTRANVKDVSYDYISSANWSYLEGAFRTKEWPLKVAPLAHFMMGGVCITPGCDTAIPGVFAAGEVVGGLHGANRLGGNALSECIVFGARAGVSAASWAGKSKASVDGNRLAKLQALIPEFALNPGRPSPIRSYKQTLRQILWEHGGIFRERDGLTEGLRRLAELKEEVMALHSGASPLEVSRLLDLRQGILTARAILESALRREETRGAHCRTDFPLQDEKWKGSQIVSLSEENLLQFDFAPLHE